MKLTLLFVYGTLKRNQPNYHHLIEKQTGEAIFVSKAQTMNKWPLIIGSIYNIPHLLNKEGFGHHVSGELYYVNEAKLKFLDEFEKCPHYYDRQQIAVCPVNDNENLVDTSVLKPWVYVINNFKPSLLDTKLFENYDSLGSHGLAYVNKRDRNPNHSTIYEIKQQQEA